MDYVRVWSCGSKARSGSLVFRVANAILLVHACGAGRGLSGPYEDGIEKGQALPRVRGADAQEREDGGGQSALAVRCVPSGLHRRQAGRGGAGRVACVPRVAAGRPRPVGHGVDRGARSGSRRAGAGVCGPRFPRAQ